MQRARITLRFRGYWAARNRQRLKILEQYKSSMKAYVVTGLACVLTVLSPGAMSRQGTATPATAVPAPRARTAFEMEQAMTPATLLRRWNGPVVKASRRFAVPAPWIYAVMRMESGGRTMLTETSPMISVKGAQGIMQVLPQTYAQMRGQYRLGANPFDPADNIAAGTAYLRWLKGKYGFPAMFAAYNAGPGRVDDLLARGTPLPAETVAYVGGIARILDRGGNDFASIRFAAFTRPDGSQALIDPVAVRSVRAPLAGEYVTGVQSVIDMGVLKQGVREEVAAVKAAIRLRGGKV